LTAAINADVSDVGVCGFTYDGQRFDCGSVQGYVQATSAFALDRADLQDDYASYLRDARQPLRLIA